MPMRDCSATNGYYESRPYLVPPPPPESRNRPPPPPPLPSHGNSQRSHFQDRRHNLPKGPLRRDAEHNKVCDSGGRLSLRSTRTMTTSPSSPGLTPRGSIETDDSNRSCPCEYIRPSDHDLELVASMRMTPVARELWTELLVEVNRQRIKEEIGQQFPHYDEDDCWKRCQFCSSGRRNESGDEFIYTDRRVCAPKSSRNYVSRQPSPSTIDSEPKLSPWDIASGSNVGSQRSSSLLPPPHNENRSYLLEPSLANSSQSILWMLNCPDYTL